MELSQPQITPQRKHPSTLTDCRAANHIGTCQSASDQPKTHQMYKHVQTANAANTWENISQPRSTSNKNVKHVSCTRQHHGPQSASNPPRKENEKPYIPAKHAKHTELVSLRSRNKKTSARTKNCDSQHTEPSQPQINPATQVSRRYRLPEHATHETSVSLQNQPTNKWSSTYRLQSHKHTETVRPQIHPRTLSQYLQGLRYL